MSPLTAEQIRAAELLSAGELQADVAREVDVSVKTLQRWKKIPEFQLALKSPEFRQEMDDLLKKRAEVDEIEVISTAHASITAISATPSAATRQEMRSRELARLEMAENAILDRVQSGDLRATAIFLRISERRCKLFGLDSSNIPLVDAVQVLVTEKVLPSEIGRVILKGIADLEKSLREEWLKNEKMRIRLEQLESESGT